jgi:Uma2 family endonuclease
MKTMAAAPNPPLVSVEEYLATDGNSEYLDGVVVARNVGTPKRSALQKILIIHLAAFEKTLNLAVRPECRTRIQETRYRVPDILVMAKPFRQTDRVVLDAPVAVIEILSPDDRMKATLECFHEYEKLGVRHIIQMDPEDRTTYVFEKGNLVRKDLEQLWLDADRRYLPFNSRELLSLLDEE